MAKFKMEYMGASLRDDELVHSFKLFDPIYINIIENEDNKEAIYNLIKLCEEGKVEVEVKKLIKKKGRPPSDDIYNRFEVWLMNRGISIHSAKRYSHVIKKMGEGKINVISPYIRTAIKHWYLFLSEINSEKKSKNKS